MMAQPEDLLFSKEHEWLKIDGDVGTVGITDYAQNSLGDIVYVELPRVGHEIKQFGSNGGLETDPALVNRDAFGAGWLYKVRIKGLNEKSALLSPSAYDALIAEAA